MDDFIRKIHQIRAVTTGLITNETRQIYPHYDIGEYTYGNPKIISWGVSKLIIGKFCSIAKGVEIILDGEHHTDWVTTFPLDRKIIKRVQISDHPTTKGDVIIGHDVWIGRGAKILSGVQLGHGVVVGAYAVVAKSIPPYSIVVGNPCKVIKRRFDQKTIDDLLRVKWWDWEIDQIINSIPLLMSPNIDKILQKK